MTHNNDDEGFFLLNVFHFWRDICEYIRLSMIYLSAHRWQYIKLDVMNCIITT